MNLEQFVVSFEKADDKGKWELLRDNKKLEMVVMLDNDCTTVCCDNDDEIYLSFNEDIGNRAGIHCLLSIVGIKAEDV